MYFMNVYNAVKSTKHSVLMYTPLRRQNITVMDVFERLNV